MSKEMSSTSVRRSVSTEKVKPVRTTLEKGLIVLTIILLLVLGVGIYLNTIVPKAKSGGVKKLKTYSSTTKQLISIDGGATLIRIPVHQTTIKPPDDRYVLHGDLPKSKVCETMECKTAAAYYKSNMDPKVDPCEDFYQYVCGGWLNKTAIPPDEKIWGTFNVLRTDLSKNCVELLEKTQVLFPTGAVENAKALFQRCVDIANTSDAEGIRQLKSLISNYSEMPFLNTSRKVKSVDWPLLVAKITRDFKKNFIINFVVAFDIKNTSRKIIYLDQPTFGISREILVSDHKNSHKKEVAAYKNYIKNTFCLMLGNCSEKSVVGVTKEVNLIFHFESSLAKMTIPNEERRNPKLWYSKRTLADLAKIIPQIAWKQYLDVIFSGIGENVSENTELIVRGEPYFKKIHKFLQATEYKTITSYVTWRLLQNLGPLASASFRNNEFDFRREIEGITKLPSIQQECFVLVNSLMGYAVGQLYVNEFFTRNAKAEINEISMDLIKAMDSMIDKNSWMDEMTKKEAKKKISTIQNNIGFPEWILDDEELNKFYNGVGAIDENGIIVTIAKARSFHLNKELKQLQVLPDSNREWKSSPAIVNAMYSPSENKITFPAGILQPPFYRQDALSALNYGAIGLVIGHQIARGFDEQGSHYDSKGNSRTWWTKTTTKNYNKKKECLSEQYRSIKDTKNKTNGRNRPTIENFADYRGLTDAYLAFTTRKNSDDELRLPGFEEMTHKQLFFIASTSIWCEKTGKERFRNQLSKEKHTPGKYRANFPLSNHEEFAEVFNCPIGSNMNPKKKCVLW